MLLKNNVTGLQHIGIPVVNLKESIEWYSRIGFEVAHQKNIVDTDGNSKVNAAFLRLGDLTIELYQLNSKEVEEIRKRAHGHIDHLALNVKDIEKAYNELKESEFIFLEDGISELPFFENGVKFFIVLGPNGEKVEFNQYL